MISRIEDPLPECEEKKDFETHLNAYIKKLMRCNVCWTILGCILEDNEGYYCAAEKSPCFWDAALYGIKMSLITDIYSFISDDDEGLTKFLHTVRNQKDKIFTRRVYVRVKDMITGEEKEFEDIPDESIDEVLSTCSKKLRECKRPGTRNVLNNARSKVYCHLDSLAIASPEEQKREVFDTISDKMIEDELQTIGEILNLLEIQYKDSKTALKYTNIDDIKNTFTIMKNNRFVNYI